MDGLKGRSKTFLRQGTASIYFPNQNLRDVESYDGNVLNGTLGDKRYTHALGRTHVVARVLWSM